MEEKNGKTDQDAPQDMSRRNFLKLMSVLAVGAAVAGSARSVIQNIIPQSSGVTTFPTLTLVDSSNNAITTSSLKVNDPNVVVFDYPLQGDPTFLLRLGDSSNKDVEIKAVSVDIPATGKSFQSPGGVGPYKSVVASSAICEHLGCVPPMIHYYQPGTTIPGHPNHSGSNNPGYIHCNCHGSTYDPLNGFKIVTGPTQKPLPNATLSYDSTKDTYSVVSMVGPTIYGKSSDLTGGSPLPSNTQTVVQNQGNPTS